MPSSSGRTEEGWTICLGVVRGGWVRRCVRGVEGRLKYVYESMLTGVFLFHASFTAAMKVGRKEGKRVEMSA